MTAVLPQQKPWTVQPGWGIYVDLTPPELLASRRVRLVRQLVAAALVAVLTLCGVAYFLADRQRSDAQTALSNAQLATTALQRKQASYSGLIKVQAATKQIETELAGLMKSDVALDELVYRIADCAVTGMTIDNTVVSLNQTYSGAQTSNLPGQIDNFGHVQIGNVTLTGSTGELDDVATFVNRLAAIPGVLNVVPTSNARGDHGVTFNVTFALDDRVLSHRFDIEKGGK